MSGEARGCVDILAGRYNKKTDEDIYLAGFSGDSVKFDRISRPGVNLVRPCLTVLWLFQPDKLRELVDKPSFSESGFLPRFLMFISNAEPQFEPETLQELSPATLDQWSNLITRVAEKFHESSTPFQILPAPGVKQMFRDYYNRIIKERRSDGSLFDVSSFAARWNELAWRLALILHVGQYGEIADQFPLSVLAAYRGITLMGWFASQQLKVIAAAREKKVESIKSKLYELLYEAPDYCVALRKLRDHGISAAEVRSLADRFPHLFVIQTIKSPGPGRPSIVVKMEYIAAGQERDLLATYAPSPGQID